MAEGRYDASKRWLLIERGSALAALTRYPSPRPIYALRTAPELSEEAEAKLLEFAAALGEGDEPATLNFDAATAVDLSKSALRRGWVLEAHVKGFDTPLADRADLKPDPTAQAFPLDHLQSEAFADFYRPIWQTDAERQGLRPFEEEVASFRENVGAGGEGVYLTSDGVPVAAGVADYDSVATMTLIGVLPERRRQGWGMRLHRHLILCGSLRSTQTVTAGKRAWTTPPCFACSRKTGVPRLPKFGSSSRRSGPLTRCDRAL